MPRQLGPAIAVRRKKGPRSNDLEWNVLYPEEFLNIRVTMREVFGNPEIVGLAIEPVSGTSDPTIVTAELLRRIPMAKLKAACLSDLAGVSEPSFLETVSDAPKRGQAPVPVEKLKRAASEYEAAVKSMESPIKRIEREMEIKPATARKYVARARALGLLGYPERPGGAGTSSLRSPITGRTRDPS